MNCKDYLNNIYVEDFELANKLVNEFNYKPKHVMNMFSFNKAQRKAFTEKNYKGFKSVNDKSVRSNFFVGGPSIKITPRMCNVIKGCRYSGWQWDEIGNLFNTHKTTPQKALKRYDKDFISLN